MNRGEESAYEDVVLLQAIYNSRKDIPPDLAREFPDMSRFNLAGDLIARRFIVEPADANFESSPEVVQL